MEFIKKTVRDYDEYTFGKYVRNRRRELGFSGRNFAKKMQISAVYLCDIERGKRKVPLNPKNGRDYMSDFIKYLQIDESEIETFYEMADATRNFYPDIQEYLKYNKYAMIAVRLAKKINLSDKEWKNFISYMQELEEKDI